MPLKVRGTTAQFTVVKLLGKTDTFNLYLCKAEGDDRQCILKIAASAAQNPLLDREAFLLRSLRLRAEELEAAYARVKKGDGMLNYQLLFPEVVDSFIVEEQGGRRVNILRFEAIDDVGELVPIGHITSRDRVRVDPRTSAWIMGKVLKALAFFHAEGISIDRLTGENILIERKQHYVVFFDWTNATQVPEEVTSDVAMEEISKATREVIIVLGGNPILGTLPKDAQLEDDRYAAMLHSLASGGYSDAGEAHAEFYKLIRALWPRAYHHYTSYPLN
jgi:hypothetical protein